MCEYRRKASWVKAKGAVEKCRTLRDPRDCSPPGSSVHGISQARILGWVAISLPGGLPNTALELMTPASPATWISQKNVVERSKCRKKESWDFWGIRRLMWWKKVLKKKIIEYRLGEICRSQVNWPVATIRSFDFIRSL